MTNADEVPSHEAEPVRTKEEQNMTTGENDADEGNSNDRELRIISVSATVSPVANEEALAEAVRDELRGSDTFEGSVVEFGTVDVYEHRAHSGMPDGGWDDD